MRAHTRYPLKTRVRVSWEDERGSTRVGFGQSVDIGERGLGFLLPDPLPVRCYVNFEILAMHMQGSGSVRFLQRKGLGYYVGIEFSGQSRWDPDKYPLPEA